MTAKNNGKRLPNLRILVISLTEASKLRCGCLPYELPKAQIPEPYSDQTCTMAGFAKTVNG